MLEQASLLQTSSPNVIDDWQVLDLIRELCVSLDASKINYCHWKSNAALDRSACGKNDLDLLIARADSDRFYAIIHRLGFKEFYPSSDEALPGIQNFYGYDRKTVQWVHLHVHFQLMVGNDFTKSFHLPLEKPYLESAFQYGLFRIPAPEFELLVFTIRMTLKHSTWDSILGRQGSLSPSEKQELIQLSNTACMQKVYQLLAQHLPALDQDLFEACLQSIQPNAGFWFRVRTGQKLLSALRDCNRRTQLADLFLKGQRRIKTAFQTRVLRKKSKLYPARGGMLIAFVGGDGAGKTTAIKAMDTWLSKHFYLKTVHMGKPAWSLATILIRGILKIGTLLRLYPFVTITWQEMLDLKELKFPGYPWLLREVCTARDRYLVYHQARRAASNGSIVICDRFPLDSIKLMDGLYPIDRFAELFPQKIFMRSLISIANRYYQSILSPELLLIMKVDPETAVQRKVDEEQTYVRARTSEIWNTAFDAPQMRIIDANQEVCKVHAEIRDVIWMEI